jgi:F-type H+-transporting ATPase subunit a
MGFEFLDRTMRATAALTCVAALAGAAFVTPVFGLAVALGSAWSLLNFAVLAAFVRQIGPKGRLVDPLRALLLLGVKGPLLYGAGWLLLRAGLPAVGLAAGFALLFLAVTLRGLARLIAPSTAGRATSRGATLGLILCAAAALATSPGVAGAQHGDGHATLVAGAPAAPDAHSTDAHAPAAQPTPVEAAVEGEPVSPEHPGGGHGEGEGHPELPNLVTYLRSFYQGHETPGWLNFLHEWENVFFSLLAALLLIALFGAAAAPRALVPTGLQNFGEWLLGGLHDFFLGVLGPGGRGYVPFVASLFLYIVTMNWFGMVPFLKSPNASLNTTLALALCVFVYVQYIGIRRQGLGGYLYHFAGQPKDAIGWASAVLLFPLEVMGEVIKPVSLACRLFGNILGEDILIAVFVGLGVTSLSFIHSPIGLPLQLPFYLLSALFGVIQGLVFALLATVYIVMMLPHDEHHGHHEAHPGDPAVAHP